MDEHTNTTTCSCASGYEAVAQRVQELYLSGRKAGAAAAVPTELVEQVALIGPLAKVRRDLDRWDTRVVDVIAIRGLPDDVGSVARLL
jgi:hypothetical protein